MRFTDEITYALDQKYGEGNWKYAIVLIGVSLLRQRIRINLILRSPGQYQYLRMVSGLFRNML